MGNAQDVIISYDDSVLPTGSDEPILFDTSVACTGKRQINGVGGGQKRFLWNIVHDNPGNLRLEKSSDRGVTWVPVITVPSASGVDGGFVIQHYDDFRILWVNLAVDQLVWDVTISLTGMRHTAGVAGDA